MGLFSELLGYIQQKEQTGTSTFSEKDFLIHGDMLSSLDKDAKIAYDSYFSGNIETFNSVSNRIIHDIVDECGIRNCNQPYLLGRTLFLWMINHEVNLDKTIYGVIVNAIHSCFLKCRRNMEKGVETFSKSKIVAVSKMLCVLYDKYEKYFAWMLHLNLPKASVEVVIHQFWGLEIVSYLQVHDNKGIEVLLDKKTDVLFQSFIASNKHVINSIPQDSTSKHKLLEHVHRNEDIMIKNYDIILLPLK